MGTVRTPRQQASSRLASAALCVLFAALGLGLLGMHALASPGAGHHAIAPSMGAAMLPGATELHPEPSLVDRTGIGRPSSHDDLAMMLCGLMLAASGFAGLILRLRRGAVRQWRPIQQPATAGAAARGRPNSRGLSPPSSLAFRVIRC